MPLFAMPLHESLPGLTRQSMMPLYDGRLAIQREKNIKHWPRAWKLDLVNSSNPQWRDLYTDVTR